MANQMMRFGLVRTVRLVVAVIATIAFGGLMTHSPAARAATDPVTYVLNAIDIYGNPIEAPFNQKTIVDDKDPHASSLDVSEIIPTSLDDGRYNLYGYHTDNKSGQQVMYYNDLVKGSKPIADKLKAINVSNPQRNPANKTVNLYFAYRDAQSKKPAQITLTDDALQREAGKVKFFFTDVDGNPMREPLKYDFANVPSLNGIFEDDIGNYRYTAAVVRNPKPYGTYVYSNSKIFAHMKTNVDDLLWESILQPAYMNGFAKGPKQKWDNGSTVTFIYEKIKNTLTIEYVDEAGDSISGHPAQKKDLNNGDEYIEKAPEIDGYTLIGDDQLTGRLTEDKTLTFKYKKVVTPPNPGPTPGGGSNTDGNQTTTNPVKPTPEVTAPTTETAKQPAKVPNYAAKEGAAVYAVNHIYMYKNATFKKSQRIANYPKTKRINRPMFVVTDYARSKGGALRYKVRDVNHKSKTVGKTGYITANRKFVVKVYYSTMPKNKRVTVIAKKGVNAYQKANLTKKVKHYRTGTQLKVKKLVKHNLTTRYQLTNGNFVTTNKKLVIQGNY